MKEKYNSNNFNLFFVFFVSILIFTSLAIATTLSYDDGSKETSSGVYQNDGYAVRITPARNGQIQSMSAYVKEGTGQKGIAFIMDANHNIRSVDYFNSLPNNWSWQEFSGVSGEYSSDFYIGLTKQPSLSYFLLGIDNNFPNSRSEFSNDYDNNSSYSIISTSNYMIRTNFYYYPTVSNLHATPSPNIVTITATCTAYENNVKGAQFQIDSGSWKDLNVFDGRWDELTEEVIGRYSITPGIHTIFVKCIDKGRASTKPPASITINTDSNPPFTNISFDPSIPNGSNNWYVSNVTVILTGIDSESGIYKTYYQLTGAQTTSGFVEYTTPFTISAEGLTNIAYYSIDKANNIEPTKWSSVKLDKTPPTTPTLNAFSHDFINGLSETVSWTASNDSISGFKNYKIYRKINDLGNFSNIASTTSTFYVDSTLVNDNKYNYYITAVDNAGNESSASNQDWFAVDMNAPSEPFLTALPAYTGNSGTVNLSWTDSIDPGIFPSGINSYELDKDSITANVGLVTAYSDSGNADATTHSYKVRALDNSTPSNYSNWSNTETTTIDLSAPKSTATLNPTLPNGLNNWYVSPVSVKIEASDSASGISSIYYCIDNSDTCTPNIEYTGEFVVSTEGINFVRYYSVDNVGNAETVKSIGSFKIDLSAPSNASIFLDDGAEFNTTGSVHADMTLGSDDYSGLAYCELSWDNGSTWENTDSLTTAGPHAYSDGLQIVQFKCFDNAGNESTPAFDSIIVDTTVPISEITYPAPGDIVLKGNILIQGTASDNASGVKKVQLKALDSEGNTVVDWTDASGTVVWSGFVDLSSLPNGTYTIKSRAEDNAGWQEADANIIITVIPNSSPNIENTYYKHYGNKFVLLSGYLDLVNKNYTVDIIDLEQGLDSNALYTYSIITNNNSRFNLNIDVNSWDSSKLYAARISLYNGEKLYSQFDTLAVASLKEEINEIWNSIIDPQEQIDALNAKINDLNARISALSIDLHAHIANLQAQINNLRNALQAMNHITINTSYNANSKKLSVWGEAPEGSTEVSVVVISQDNRTVCARSTARVNSDNEYKFSVFSGNALDLNNCPAKTYNVLVSSTAYLDIYLAGTVFDGLWIQSTQEKINELDEKVDMLNSGNLQFNYNSTSNVATFLGEAPTEAKCVSIWAFSSSGRLLGIFVGNVSENSQGADYSISENVSNWPQETINVYASFYSNFGRGCSSHHLSGYLGTVQDTFDALLSEDLFGFRDITVSTFVTSYYLNNVKIPITFALKTDKTEWFGGMLYTIEYRTNPWKEWKTLTQCSYYPEGIKTYHNGNIELKNTGIFEVELRAVRCGFGIPQTEDYRSFMFKIKHVDLKDKLRAYTKIISPEPNNNEFSVANDVYWTQSGNVPLVSFLTTNTEQDRPMCEVYYYDNYGVERHIGNYPSIEQGRNKFVCNIGEYNFGTQEWNNSNNNAGKYTVIRVYNDVVAQADSFDEIKIGIDNNAPIIVSINPDEGIAMNGIYRWYAGITDNLSGVSRVDFYLIEKSGYKYCLDYNCWIGDGNILWTVSGVNYDSELGKFYYDLDTTNFPDGDYNVGFRAIDIAGNYSYKEIDPLIDNTKPVISSISITPSTQFRNYPITITAIVSDNLSGVNNVWATITTPSLTTETIMLSKSGSQYIGTYNSSMSSDLGIYNVVVDANDNAGNNAIPQTGSFELTYKYLLDIVLSDNPVIVGSTLTVNGSLTMDDGTQLSDKNIDITYKGITTTLTTDINGLFSMQISADTVGDFNVDANIIAPNGINYTDFETLTVNSEPKTPNTSSGSGYGGGSVVGGGGSYCGDKVCNYWENSTTCPKDCPASTTTENNESSPPVLGPYTGYIPDYSLNEQTSQSETETKNIIVPATNIIVTPTGFVNLGPLGNVSWILIAGLVVLVVVFGTGYWFVFARK